MITLSVGGVRMRFDADAVALPLLERFRGFSTTASSTTASSTTASSTTASSTTAGDHDAIHVGLALRAPTPDDVPTDGARFTLAEHADELVLTGENARAVISADNRRAHLAGAATPQPLHALVRLLLARALLERDTLLLHASAVVMRDSSAAMFVGPSGAGKTTIASTLAGTSQYTIAADEAVVTAVVTVRGADAVHISGTPWWQGNAVTAPLQTLLFIERGIERSWRPVAPSQAAALLFNAAGPLPASAAERALTVAARTIERVPRVARVTLSSRDDILDWLAPRLQNGGD